MMDLDFLSTSSSDRVGLSGVGTGSDFTAEVRNNSENQAPSERTMAC